MAKKKKQIAGSITQLTTEHTNLGMRCGEVARDSTHFERKTRKIFESFSWTIYEQVKALQSGEHDSAPAPYVAVARREVDEANAAVKKALTAHTEEQAALAAVEAYQAIDSVDGILGGGDG